MEKRGGSAFRRKIGAAHREPLPIFGKQKRQASALLITPYLYLAEFFFNLKNEAHMKISTFSNLKALNLCLESVRSLTP
jgi:hypothetical protein